MLEEQIITELDPETLVMAKEKMELTLKNPCIQCVHNDSEDPAILDYCYCKCQEPELTL